MIRNVIEFLFSTELTKPRKKKSFAGKLILKRGLRWLRGELRASLLSKGNMMKNANIKHKKKDLHSENFRKDFHILSAIIKLS